MTNCCRVYRKESNIERDYCIILYDNGLQFNWQKLYYSGQKLRQRHMYCACIQAAPMYKY